MRPTSSTAPSAPGATLPCSSWSTPGRRAAARPPERRSGRSRPGLPGCPTSRTPRSRPERRPARAPRCSSPRAAAATTSRTEELLAALRDGQPAPEQATGTTLGVTGLTAIQTDVSERLSGALAPYLAIVVGLAFVLLMMVFRSVLVPLTAIGRLPAVDRSPPSAPSSSSSRRARRPLGVARPAPIISLMPILVIGILFGLAMDYQVFLVSRMREALRPRRPARRTPSPRASVRRPRRHRRRADHDLGLRRLHPRQDDRSSSRSASRSRSAVLFDAFIVRMTLIPAVMTLLGDRPGGCRAGSTGSCPTSTSRVSH